MKRMKGMKRLHGVTVGARPVTPFTLFILFIPFILFTPGLLATAGCATSATGAAGKDGRTEVVFWHMWTGEWEEVVNRIVARFNASQDRVRVQPLVVTGDANTKLLLAIAGGVGGGGEPDRGTLQCEPGPGAGAAARCDRGREHEAPAGDRRGSGRRW